MIAAVEAIAAERGQVDPADERDLAVDDHELLVVAMHRALVGVERALHARAADELVAHAPHGRRAGVKTGTGAPAHSSTLTSTRSASSPSRSRSLTASIVARQPEIGRDVPAGDVHASSERPRAPRRARQRLRPVDQHLERAPVARRRIARRPQRRVPRGGSLPS